MLAEKYLNGSRRRRRKTRLLIKSTGALRFVPLIIFNVLIPILTALTYYSYQNFSASAPPESRLLFISQFFIPLFSVWTPLFSLREIIEAEGNEVLYTSDRLNPLAEASRIFLLSLSNVLFLFILFILVAPSFYIEVLRIVPVCIFCFGLMYFSTFLFNSVSISLFTVVFYIVYNSVVRNGEYKPLVYMSAELLDETIFFKTCVPLLIIGAVLILLGKIAEKKNKRLL